MTDYISAIVEESLRVKRCFFDAHAGKIQDAAAMIAEALRKHKGNISRAARELGLTRRGLYLKLGRHEMSASA